MDRKIFLLFLIFVSCFMICCFCGPTIKFDNPSTILQDYVDTPDPAYKWYELVNDRYYGDGYTAYVINQTSLTWLEPSDFSTTEYCHTWWHRLYIIVPDFINPAKEFNSVASIYIINFVNTDTNINPLWDIDQWSGTVDISMSLGIVTALLLQIPNAPCVFSADPIQEHRTEDAILAFAWNQYYKTANPLWLPRLPMVKSVVRAMDTITSFMNTLTSSKLQITNFITMGESKRGWTTWLTGVVDDRIIGIVPMVMDELNTIKNFHHHFMSYGNWSFVLNDYYKQNITLHLDTPQIATMMSIIDPFVYRDRLNKIAIYNIASGNDEFFLIDDSLYFRSVFLANNASQGIYNQHMNPNCEHELQPPPCRILVMSAIKAWINTILTGRISNEVLIPKFSWTIADNTGDITLTPETGTIRNVNVWYTHTVSNKRRDFRIVRMNITGGPDVAPILQFMIWTSKPVLPHADGNYIANMPMPTPNNGWTAFFMNIEYYSPSGDLLEFTTDVSIIPQELPFPDCQDESCYGGLV